MQWVPVQGLFAQPCDCKDAVTTCLSMAFERPQKLQIFVSSQRPPSRANGRGGEQKELVVATNTDIQP